MAGIILVIAVLAIVALLVARERSNKVPPRKKTLLK
jgi:hypothetical protein